MKILVDTQAVIWFAENNHQLSDNARKVLENTENECFISMASFWEIAIKMSLGKLDINGLTLPQFFDEVTENNFLMLDINRNHILEVEKLPFHHRDPFDRMIIAQAKSEKMEVLSVDEAFDMYLSNRIW